MNTRLLFAAGFAVTLLVQSEPAAAQPSNAPAFFIPNSHGDAHRRAGGHYSIVVANLTRRCTDLSNQFDHARATIADTRMIENAMTDYQEGTALCGQGQRLQGIGTLEAALREIGAIPRITY